QDENRAFLESRYRLPIPALQLGQALVGCANACLDISDGLLADVGHICTQSHVGITIYKNKIPLSGAGREAVENYPEFWKCVYGGGDDYELLFTIPPEMKEDVLRISRETQISVTQIGEVTAGSHPELLDDKGQKIGDIQAGWVHF
ncbi:MAG: hypothetical protein JKX94_07470, partial [Sneathiella sp.]|nr:hypothetical protein [Sneathiella sp.]